MKMKLKKSKIKSIMKSVDKYIFIDDDTYYEEFKQVYIDNHYFPYIISSFGRLFSYHGKLKELNTNINDNKYCTKLLIDNGIHKYYLVHRLVVTSFIYNNDPNTKTQVNHKDGVKNHNYIWNLEWVTPSENIIHAVNSGLFKSKTKGNKYNEDDIINAYELIERDISFKEITNLTGVSRNMLYLILTGKNWRRITKSYDFSNYTYGRGDKHKIYKICDLLESKKYTIKEISIICNVNVTTVYDILHGKYHTDISKKYNLTNVSEKHRMKNKN
jgi:hypothetical protein